MAASNLLDPTNDDVAAAMAGVSYRRNGKLFSCEPCRKGKLKCDHTTPTCGRCLRRGKADQCIYHPAPLTKPRGIGGDTTKTSSPQQIPTAPRFSPYPQPRSSGGMISPSLSTDSTQQHETQLGTSATKTDSPRQIPTAPRFSSYPQPQSYGGTINPSLSTESTPVLHTHPVRDASSSVSYSVATGESCTSYRDSRHGFLGPTAFTSVFAENSESTGFDEPDPLLDAKDLAPVPQEKIQQGADVLAALRDMPLFRQFTRRWFDLYDGLIILQPVFRIWFDDLWNEWGPILTNGSRSQLLRLSELVWRNTRQPVRTDGNMSAIEWSKNATGRGIRWEVVGLILSLVGLVAINMNNWDTLFDDMQESYINRETFAERLRKLSERCLCFCYECETLNDIYLCFMYQDLVLVECMKGEVHYVAWQRTGELLDAVVAMGLHQGNYVDCETPFWLSEMRRKLFVSSYSRDKAIASFMGRPPRLSKRYCKLEMPLDLSDDELFLEGPELEAAVAKLDENGWNTLGRLSRRTWTRVWFQECLIREEILEIALGFEDEGLDERVDLVRAKLARVHKAFPAPISKLTPDDVLDDTRMVAGPRCDHVVRQINALYVVCINSGLMLTEFLLQRAVVNRSKRDTKTLIPIARKLLKTVLLAQNRRDFFRDFRSDIVYLLASYGMPSAGVLAIELLKQEQSRQYEPDLLPKSETVQDLSVFISALASVDPGEGNYKICNQGKRALTRVLDQILTPALPTKPDQPAFDDMSLYFPTANDADFLQWLDNIDWDKNFMAQPATLSQG